MPIRGSAYVNLISTALLSSPWVGIHSVSRKEAQKPQKMNTIRLIAYLAHFCGKKYCRANQELISKFLSIGVAFAWAVISRIKFCDVTSVRKFAIRPA